MRRRRVVVFDLDGTLIDSRLDIAAAANHALSSIGRPPRSVDEISGFVGDGARALIARALELDEQAPQVDEALPAFVDYYTAHPATRTRLMPGAAEVLEALSGTPLGLCTNKPRRTTEAVLRAMDLSHHFQSWVAGGDTTERKPHPAPLLRVAEQLAVTPHQLVMVGDGPQDIECGRAAGALTVGILGGMLPEAQLRASAPDALLASLAELPALLEGWDHATSA